MTKTKNKQPRSNKSKDCQSELISVFVPDHEYDAICELASAMGMSCEEYIIHSVMPEKSLITALENVIFELDQLHGGLDDSNVRTMVKEARQEAQAALNFTKAKMESLG